MEDIELTISDHAAKELPPRFVFLRHGETDWNEKALIMGQKDIPLNAKGVQQAQEAAQNIVGLGITSIASSPLKRCQSTASFCAKKLFLPKVTISTLAERNWGTLEGKHRSLRRDYEKAPALGESFNCFARRTISGLMDVPKTGLPLIVAHSGTFKVLLNLDSRFDGNSTAPNAIPILFTVRSMHR